MISKDILDVINEESETMIIEWADYGSGPGYDVIEDKIYNLFVKTKKITDKEFKLVKNAVRNLILQDMILMGW